VSEQPACPTPGKLAFANKGDALAKAVTVAYAGARKPLTTYKCACGFWHLTRKASAVRS
jgi:hypothetical protein